MKAAIALVLFHLVFCGTALANDCPDPGQDAVFAINGNFPGSAEVTSVAFTREDLVALASKKAVMERPWAKTPVVIEGPLLSEVIAASGVSGNRIKIRAKNDYAAEVPLERANEFSAIVDIDMDGEKLTVRNGGPLFLLHPIVSKTSNPQETYESYSIWQVCEIEVD
ncbi:MAG: molybdopterin-dependent oxidoreductase [Rhizobiaceae bacterium]